MKIVCDIDNITKVNKLIRQFKTTEHIQNVNLLVVSTNQNV